MIPRGTTHRRWARRAAIGAFGIALCMEAPAVADQVSGLAERLASLRSDVEGLSSQLAQKTADMRDQLRSLSRQKTELELEVKKEQTRVQKVQLSISQRKKKITEEQGHDAELEPLLTSTAEQVRQYVKTTLPFRAEERLAEIDKIEEQHKSGLLSTSKALSRLWTFLEDEFRLTRESGLFKQTITIDGKEQLAEVVRIGMVMLYFKTGDSDVGYARRTDSGWEFKVVDSPDEAKLIVQLFDSFKKQIRVGFFQLPASLGKVTQATVPVVPAEEAAKPDTAAKDDAKPEDKAGDAPVAKQEPAAATPGTAEKAAPKTAPKAEEAK